MAPTANPLVNPSSEEALDEDLSGWRDALERQQAAVSDAHRSGARAVWLGAAAVAAGLALFMAELSRSHRNPTRSSTAAAYGLILAALLMTAAGAS